MAVMVDVTGKISGEWLREWNMLPWPQQGGSSSGFEHWATHTKAGGRQVHFIPHDHSRSLKQMLVECKDDMDAVEFKLSC